jgi:hypothetical protein
LFFRMDVREAAGGPMGLGKADPGVARHTSQPCAGTIFR